MRDATDARILHAVLEIEGLLGRNLRAIQPVASVSPSGTATLRVTCRWHLGPLFEQSLSRALAKTYSVRVEAPDPLTRTVHVTPLKADAYKSSGSQLRLG